MGYLTHGATACGKTYDLLPCPHCGGEAEFRDGSSTKPYIRCKGCGCRTGSSFDYGKLASSWNRRAERTCHDTGARKVFFVCSECGEAYRKDSMRLWHHKPWIYCPNCGARIVEEGEE